MPSARPPDPYVPRGAAGDRARLRLGGASLPVDLAREAAARERFRDPPPSAFRVISYYAHDPTDQVVTSTTAVAITETETDIGLGGDPGTRWLVVLDGLAEVLAWNAADDDFFLHFQVSRDDGATWAVPDVDRTLQGAAGASAGYDVGHAESAGTGITAQARCRCVFAALWSDAVRVRLVGYVGPGGTQSATVRLNSTVVGPRITGFALASRD